MIGELDIQVNYISEKDMDLLIIEEFISNDKFAKIFLDKLDILDFSVLEAHHSMVDVTYGESDMLFVLESQGKIIGILIEDKIDAIAMPEQYNRYVKRAEILKESSLFSEYHIFIVAPKIYIDTNFEAKKYPNSVTYEELLDYFSKNEGVRNQYKQVIIGNAINKKLSGYIPIEDEAVTMFWQEYYRFKNEHFPQLNLNEVTGPRGANATWPWFTTENKLVKIAHKSFPGFIDLTFNKLGQYISELKNVFSGYLDDDMTIKKTNKSACIRIKVPPIDFKKEFSTYIDEMIICLKSVDRLQNLLKKIDIDSLYEELI